MMSDEPQQVPQDDLDSLFESAQAGFAADVPDGVVEALGGPAVEALVPFAIQAREVLTVGLESVAGKHVTLDGTALAMADAAAVAGEFASGLAVAFDVRVSLPGEQGRPLTVIVPAADLGALFSLEMGAEPMEEGAFAQGQADTVAASLRELLDLVSLTLLGEHLEGVEATLAETYVGDVAPPLHASGGAVLRIDLTLGLPEERTARVTMAVPVPVLERLSALLAAEAEEESGASRAGEPEESAGAAPREQEPTPIRGARATSGAGGASDAGEPPGFGLADSTDRSPARRAGMFGTPTGDDVDVHPVRFPTLSEPDAPSTSVRSLDLIMDVSMRVTVELGRSTMTVEEVLSLGPGSVVELNKLAGEPVDILVNDQLIARGEVVVVDENFGVRVTEIVSPRRRAHAMGA
jgi:flagellar motor switch protein FliN